VLTYVVATMCVMDKAAEHDDEDILERPAKVVVLTMTICEQRLLSGMTTYCCSHCLMTSSSSECFV